MRDRRAWIPAALFIFGACTGSEESTSAPSEPEHEAVIPGSLVQEVWMVHFADDAARAPYEADEGWAELVMNRDLSAALSRFSATGGDDSPPAAGLARTHAALAASYRQAARLAAWATVQVYGETAREEDPEAASCLVGVSELLLGRYADAESRLASCDPSSHESLAEVRDAWRAWLSADRPWPPAGPLAATPGDPGDPRPGGLPDAGDLPHYRFRDRIENLEVPAADPGSLLELALYHENAAQLAHEGESAVVDVWLAPWRLPVEPSSSGVSSSGDSPATLQVGDAFLFGTPWLTGADLVLRAELATVDRPEQVPERLKAASTSPVAQVIAPCVEPASSADRDPSASAAGSVDPSCVLDRAAAAYEQVKGAMEIRGGGEQGFHKPFADLARVGVVRIAAAVAEAMALERSMGILRLNALDLSRGASAEPAYLLSLAAWDASNRNALRATDLLHAQVGHLPGVEVARYPLDALQIRLGRESAPGLPMH